VLVHDSVEFVPLLFGRNPVFRNLNVDAGLIRGLLSEFVHRNAERVQVLAIHLDSAEPDISGVTDATDVVTNRFRDEGFTGSRRSIEEQIRRPVVPEGNAKHLRDLLKLRIAPHDAVLFHHKI